MASLPSVVKENLGNILTAATLIGLATTYLATKSDVDKVGRSVNILRLEINMKISQDKLLVMDAIMIKTPAQKREVEALVEGNLRMQIEKDKLIHATN